MRLLLAIFALLFASAAPAAAAPTWLPATNLQAGAPDDIDGAIAETPNGTRFVTLVSKQGANDVARVRVRRPGGGFGPTITLTSTDGRDAYVSDVAVDGAVAATVVWDEDKSAASSERQLR